MKLIVILALLFFGFQPAFSQERTVEGRVFDVDGRPIANASVAPFWRANGSSKKADGTEFNLQDKTQLQEFWGRLGQMEPLRSTVTNDDGSFSVILQSRDRVLFAMNSDRTHGCIVDASETDARSPISMQLAPLVTVTGTFRSSVESKSLDWCHVYVELPVDEKNPLASNRLISCGSFEKQFEVKLPPGNYELDAYAVSDAEADDIDLRVQPSPKFTVRSTDNKLDVGILNLTLAPPDRSSMENESKIAGRWMDYTKHYGEPAPEWHSVDGRGNNHQENLKSLKGKWVILEFWGMGCAPCLARGIPKMVEFYELNSKSKEKFEVVGICIDYTGEIDSVSKLDRELASVEKNVWKGKKIPFPIVIDNTFKTWERYGIDGLGTVVLIDPDGRIVEGDESTLQAILDKVAQ